MTTPSRDSALLARVAGGDHQAFDEVMREHESRIFAVCLRMLGDREQALDATQDTFLTVFRKSSQFRGDSSLGTWMYRIAVNTCYDHLRRRSRKPTSPLPDHLEVADPSAEDALASAGMRPEIAGALALVPPEFRAAMVLCDIEGMATADAAEVLGVATGTIKSRLHRGRRLMAEHLGNREGA